jgi:hypothetical protein
MSGKKGGGKRATGGSKSGGKKSSGGAKSFEIRQQAPRPKPGQGKGTKGN